MSVPRWLGLIVARIVALAVTMLGVWLFTVNIVGIDYHGWVLGWILLSGLAGAIGGPLFLLSLDGPSRFRTMSWRMLGWWLMLASVLLPSSLSLVMVPLVALLLPGFLFMKDPESGPKEGAATSA